MVSFVTAGDPDTEEPQLLVPGMCAAGLDVLELGVPFSDPTADGPVIQRARPARSPPGRPWTDAGHGGALRRETQVPMIVFSYYNPILAYGASGFHRDAVAAGTDGVLLVDVPPEESGELTAGWPPDGLCLIRLTTPTTPTERMRRIAAAASGFIYHVSKLGVTGSDGLQVDTVAARYASCARSRRCRSASASGYHPRGDRRRGRACDGVVVGSAFERLIEENLGPAGPPGPPRCPRRRPQARNPPTFRLIARAP